MTFHKAYRYLQTRTQWMRYHLYKRQKFPLGSGITEAGCKIVFRQRLKRSGMSWTIEGGQTILDLRVIKLSQVWNTVYQRSWRPKRCLSLRWNRSRARRISD